jgi:hypothetical protein
MCVVKSDNAFAVFVDQYERITYALRLAGTDPRLSNREADFIVPIFVNKVTITVQIKQYFQSVVLSASHEAC